MRDYQKGTSLERPDTSKIEQLRQVCRPVVEYLRENHTPYEKIIIDWVSAELVSGNLGAAYEIPD